jgi:glycosyltransferase involved in cell wall biosynthesis
LLHRNHIHQPTLLSVFGVKPLRIGGTETFARELSRQLSDRGWQSVLCFLSEPTAEVKQFLDLPNISFEVLENSTNGNREARRNLARIISRHRPEILHLHYVSFLNLYSWSARLRSVRQVFFTDHHSRPAEYVASRASLWKRALARLINYPVSKVICVSNYGYECMTSVNLLPRDRFEMIYNGVDFSRVKTDPLLAKGFRERYAIPDNRAIVTQVSWIIPEKGIADFIETARLVLQQNRNVQFVLVGDGVDRQQYETKAKELGFGNHLTWTGMIDDPFGEGVFLAADIVCQFSRWEEVFGWMIAEGMAHEKPVVATRVGGIPEVVTDCVTGFLVDRGDTQAMSERVLELLSDSGLRRSMGASGRATADAKFDLSRNVSRLIESYGLGEVQSQFENEQSMFEVVDPT